MTRRHPDRIPDTRSSDTRSSSIRSSSARGPSAAWPAVALVVAVGTSTVLTARGLIEHRRRRRDHLPLAVRRLEVRVGAHRPGDG